MDPTTIKTVALDAASATRGSRRHGAGAPGRGRRRLAQAALLSGAVAVTGCSSQPMQPGSYHLGSEAAKAAVAAEAEAAGDDSVPGIVGGVMMPPQPQNGPRLETYSVVVSDVEIAELLFAMARDAKIDVDVHPAVRGRVTLNAVNQTLPQILSRLSRQIDLRYEFDGHNLVVLPDLPFLRHYTVDYVNIAREAQASTSIATQIASAGRDALATGGSGGGQLSNNSTTQIVNTSNNRFWSMLVENLHTLLDDGRAPRGQDANGAGGAEGGGAGGAGGAVGAGGDAPAGGNGGQPSSQAASASRGADTSDGVGSTVIASPETGLVSVRGTQRQHERVQTYLDKLLNSARRQVLIEATIAEVQLSEQFQQGVNWSRVRADGSGWAFQQQPSGTGPIGTGVLPGSGPGGVVFPQNPAGTNDPGGAAFNGGQTPSLGVLRYLNTSSTLGSIGAAVSLLQTFGKVKVLSSPKISVLNNQTAVLKVVDNKVYFTIGVQITPGTATTAPLVTYTSTPNTVPVGFVMSVTPQIEESGTVTINVRPTISRIVGYVTDPNPALASSNVTSRIPEIQTRELESILKVTNGDVAVMGGLMQESVNDQTDGVPGAASVPLFGNLFKYRNDASTKSELVIFLRPIVVRDPSMDGDYRSLKPLQPGPDFFTKPVSMPLPRAWQPTSKAAPAVSAPAHAQVPAPATPEDAGSAAATTASAELPLSPVATSR